MKKITICCFIAIYLANLPLAAQETKSDGFFQNFGIAVKAGILGAGADFATSLHPNIKMRLGINYFGFLKPNIDINFNGKSIDLPKRDVPVHVKNISTDFLTGNLLIDLFPLKSLGFHITAGVYIGKTDIAVTGFADEDFEVEGYRINPYSDGSIKASLRLGNLFKPYVGLGIGHTIPKSIVGYKIDAGLFYQGTYKVIGDNTTKDLSTEVAKLDIPEFFKTFFPVLSFSLTFKIK